MLNRRTRTPVATLELFTVFSLPDRDIRIGAGAQNFVPSSGEELVCSCRVQKSSLEDVSVQHEINSILGSKQVRGQNYKRLRMKIRNVWINVLSFLIIQSKKLDVVTRSKG